MTLRGRLAGGARARQPRATRIPAWPRHVTSAAGRLAAGYGRFSVRPRSSNESRVRTDDAKQKRGQGRDRTGDLPLFRRTLVPTELPGQRNRPDPHLDPARSATPTGLEPATSAVTGRRANQLRHGALTRLPWYPDLRSDHRFRTGTPNGIRTRATALKGRRPRPLDDGGWAVHPPPTAARWERRQAYDTADGSCTARYRPPPAARRHDGGDNPTRHPLADALIMHREATASEHRRPEGPRSGASAEPSNQTPAPFPARRVPERMINSKARWRTARRRFGCDQNDGRKRRCDGRAESTTVREPTG